VDYRAEAIPKGSKKIAGGRASEANENHRINEEQILAQGRMPTVCEKCPPNDSVTEKPSCASGIPSG
jgi:hypothetical protein